jgi:hypothetical protein
MAAYLEHFKELYADYGEQRRKEVNISDTHTPCAYE